ncbi:unnamed protein product [Prunus armeniaca]|uniref:PSI-K n=1 Tax=Prunus armeniaca TaxID=36596 RepID=A0A6J5X2D6_PRUAR|nr:unnamed protein product [Prunus armeniaca]
MLLLGAQVKLKSSLLFRQQFNPMRRKGQVLWVLAVISLAHPPIWKATAGLKLETRDSGLQTGDPAGFTLADTLACGSVGHIIGVGVVLGLKNIGSL